MRDEFINMALFELNPLPVSTETLYVETIQWIQDILGKQSLTVDNFRDMEQLIQPVIRRCVCIWGKCTDEG